jgi:hypothetical protein
LRGHPPASAFRDDRVFRRGRGGRGEFVQVAHQDTGCSDNSSRHLLAAAGAYLRVSTRWLPGIRPIRRRCCRSRLGAVLCRRFARAGSRDRAGAAGSGRLGRRGGHGARDPGDSTVARSAAHRRNAVFRQTPGPGRHPALGRLATSEALEALVTFLQNKQWARYAADALGDVGGEEAAAALLAAYPDYARGLNRPANPRRIHVSDTGSFDPRDRIPAAAYAIAMSLSRIGSSSPSRSRPCGTSRRCWSRTSPATPTR